MRHTTSTTRAAKPYEIISVSDPDPFGIFKVISAFSVSDMDPSSK